MTNCTLRVPHNSKLITTLRQCGNANELRLTHASVRVCPHPIAIPFYFSLAGGIFFLVWAMGLGQASFKKGSGGIQNTKFNRCLRSYYHIDVHD